MSNSLLPHGTVAPQVPLSMRFTKQEYWSGSPFPSPGDLPDQGIEPGSPVLQADSLLLSPWEAHRVVSGSQSIEGKYQSAEREC